MDELPRAAELTTASDAPVVASAHAEAFLLSPGAPVPDAAEVTFLLPSSARFAYVPRAPGEAQRHEVAPDPMLRGNAFKPLHQSPRALCAVLSIAAGRRMESGPESERLFVVLRGTGLVFIENGETLDVAPNTLAFVPAGEPARIWSRGPEDLLAIVMQPAGQKAERRTLAGEIAKRRAQHE